MGTGWSQDDPSQSQPNREEYKSSENLTEGKPAVCNTSETRSNNGNNKAIEAEKKAVEDIHNLDNIIQDADFTMERFFKEKLLSQLQHGILLNQNKQKYWVDKMGKNCFMLYARDLSITWSENNSYWMWRQLKDARYPAPTDTSEESVEVAELKNVCWLEVRGKFDTKKLSPATLYEVTFVVMLRNQAYGWEIPVNVALHLPDGRRQEKKVNMLLQPMEQWMEIPVGELRTPAETLGEIQFSMHEFDGGKWKRGLLIMGVKIHPKMKC